MDTPLMESMGRYGPVGGDLRALSSLFSAPSNSSVADDDGEAVASAARSSDAFGAVACCCYLLTRYTSFKSVVQANTLLGGDSACRAVVLGAVMGGLVGDKGIPDGWQRQLRANDEVTAAMQALLRQDGQEEKEAEEGEGGHTVHTIRSGACFEALLRARESAAGERGAARVDVRASGDRIFTDLSTRGVRVRGVVRRGTPPAEAGEAGRRREEGGMVADADDIAASAVQRVLSAEEDMRDVQEVLAENEALVAQLARQQALQQLQGDRQATRAAYAEKHGSARQEEVDGARAYQEEIGAGAGPGKYLYSVEVLMELEGVEEGQERRGGGDGGNAKPDEAAGGAGAGNESTWNESTGGEMRAVGRYYVCGFDSAALPISRQLTAEDTGLHPGGGGSFVLSPSSPRYAFRFGVLSNKPMTSLLGGMVFSDQQGTQFVAKLGKLHPHRVYREGSAGGDAEDAIVFDGLDEAVKQAHWEEADLGCEVLEMGTLDLRSV
jgi:hypothetical protein